MPFLRSHPRTTDTSDLSARLRPRGRSNAPHQVLNLSDGGMLIEGTELTVGDTAAFELSGPDFYAGGVAEVAHHGKTVTGLRFVSWDGSADHRIHRLIVGRVRRQQTGSHTGAIPETYLG